MTDGVNVISIEILSSINQLNNGKCTLHIFKFIFTYDITKYRINIMCNFTKQIIIIIKNKSKTKMQKTFLHFFLLF